MATIDAVIDLSHNNPHVDFTAVKNAGIFGVFHKATQGTGFADPAYVPRRGPAADAGLRWGSYHFGTGADGVAQANFYLATAQPAAGDLLVLDFETNPNGLTMTMAEAKAFITQIQSVTGTFPGLYGGSYLKEQLNGKADPVLSNCWLWLAQYSKQTVLPPGWSQWTFWQYSDGHVGFPPPPPLDGVGACDRDIFQGSLDDLAAFWQ